MTASVALWRGKDADARPAKAANQSPVGTRHRSLAADANAREQQVKRSFDQTSDFRIASRSGSNPNQRWKESAPCSMSIGKPSAARFP